MKIKKEQKKLQLGLILCDFNNVVNLSFFINTLLQQWGLESKRNEDQPI